MFGFGKGSMDKAIDVVGGAVDKGMSIWDNADFTPADKADMFAKLAEAMKSQATSISRRNLLKFIIATMTLSFVMLGVYNHFGMTEQFNGIIKIVDELKIGWSFVGAVSFYYLTQFQPFGIKK